MNSNRKIARIFGLIFISTFLSYGIGKGLIDSIITVPDFLSNIYANQVQIIAGVVLMALVHTFTNIALPMLMLPILKPKNQYLAYGYLSAAIAATLILVVGTLFLLLLLPLSEAYAKAGFTMTSNFETMGDLLKKAGFYSYHMGMALWSIGGLMFISALYKSKLIPQVMSAWGIIGYIVLATGSVLEIYEHREIVDVVSVIPGGIFENTLSIWFIVQGFNSTKLEAVPLKTDPFIEVK
ncbi:MAG: hypothetical protein ACI9P5_004302 [Saprospiraceae bacterium]|jgi:hypothetical protein